jgi:hypothetical protein
VRDKHDLIIAPIGEAALIFVVAITGWVLHQPLVFTSLGPTAYELIETPNRPSARPYNIIVGHLIGVIAGFLALSITRAWWAPEVTISGVPLLRVWAAVAAASLTVLGTIALDASQPAALSTTLLVALGKMQTWHAAAAIIAAVLLMTVVGEPLRRLRVQQNVNRQSSKTQSTGKSNDER